MKLAEALSLRADLQKRLSQLNYRLQNNAKVQEGEQPAEDPAVLLSELDTISDELEALVSRINLTNAATRAEGKTLTELLSRRDALQQRCRILREFLDSASATVSRGMRSELRILPTVDVRALQKQSDALSKELRELDVTIQGVNWTTELL